MSDERPPASVATHGQSLTARISNTIVALHKQYYGKGPTKARTVFRDDLIVVLLRGGFTKVEETLLAGGRAGAVLNQRLEFQSAMRDRYAEAISDLTGRTVIGFMSGNQADPPMMVEVFVLAPDPAAPDGAAPDGAAPDPAEY